MDAHDPARGIEAPISLISPRSCWPRMPGWLVAMCHQRHTGGNTGAGSRSTPATPTPTSTAGSGSPHNPWMLTSDDSRTGGTPRASGVHRHAEPRDLLRGSQTLLGVGRSRLTSGAFLQRPSRAIGASSKTWTTSVMCTHRPPQLWPLLVPRRRGLCCSCGPPS